MIFNAGVGELPFTYTTPTYTTTNMNASAYRVGNTVYGRGTAYTTQTPGQTYSGVLCIPHGNGLVFKYVPGIEDRRKQVDKLDDERLASVLPELEALQNDPKLTFDEAMGRFGRLLSDGTSGDRQEEAR